MTCSETSRSSGSEEPPDLPPEPLFRARFGSGAGATGSASGSRVTFAGELDLAGRKEARRALDLAQRGSPSRLALDIRELTFMDVSGLKLLLEAAKRTRTQGGRLVVIAPEDPLRKLLRIAGVEERLGVVSEEVLGGIFKEKGFLEANLGEDDRIRPGEPRV